MTGPRRPFPTPAQMGARTLAQLARRPPVDLYRMVAHAPGLVEPFISMVLANFNVSLPAQLREAIVLPAALEQADPNGLCQAANGLGHRRLRETHRQRCAAEVLLACQFKEIADVGGREAHAQKLSRATLKACGCATLLAQRFLGPK